ncbi:MAG: tRNA lysidine(34) synthetase TilS [Gammaproteobacteria bacterium]
MALDPKRFFQDLDRLFPEADFLIALSGGLDSSVLLDLCAQGAGAQNRHRFLALHVNHGLHADSAEWARHCLATCAASAINARVVTLEAFAKPGRSLEDAARTARYEALRQFMGEHTVLLTAHHRDDQVETILFQLLRGGGLPGLSGMPESIRFEPGILHRPLLEISRAAIQVYAHARALNWVEDPSNADSRHDRNYLRHQVIPMLRQRWPGLDKTVSRAGRHCAEAQQILDAQVAHWFDSLVDRKRNTIRISQLQGFDAPRQKLILRHWIRLSGSRSPSEAKLQEIILEATGAAPDRIPKIGWDGVEVRRYRDELYLLKAVRDFDRSQVIPWVLGERAAIPGLGGALECRCRVAAKPVSRPRFSVRFRRGGESCLLSGGRGRHSLKKIFQELAIPPWERDRIPLVYSDEELAAVGDMLVCEPFRTLGLEVRWIRE